VTQSADAARFRWLLLAVFVLSSAINYLDRQTLASLKPVICGEFHLNNTQFGWIISAFSLTYAASAPFAGMLIDRIGLNRAISLSVGLWSCAGIATGFTSALPGLVGCRAVLGAAEAGGVPAAGKAIHQYLRPAERAVGNAMNQAGISLGMIVAPPLVTWIAVHANWRLAFVVTGLAGLLWIPLWLWISHCAGPIAAIKQPDTPRADMLRDRRLWAFVAANALSMTGYSLWTSWTTAYLVDIRKLTLVESAWISWIPPVFALAGGFTGGWLSLRMVNRGEAPMRARFRVCLLAGVLSLATAGIPFAPTAGWAVVGISCSIFAVSAFSVNMYTLPLDAFGGPRAAFAVSILVSSYGALQTVVSVIFGKTIDLYGYTPLTTAAAFTPLAACAILRAATRSAR
jgi:MFS transporter, ACS family, hexuronate transporter